VILNHSAIKTSKKSQSLLQTSHLIRQYFMKIKKIVLISKNTVLITDDNIIIIIILLASIAVDQH